MSGYLVTEGLTVGYDGKPLIRDICLGIRKGEIITLIGPNGGGKSTILKSITGHLKLISGVVTVEGEILHKLRSRDFARRISVMLTSRVSPEMMTCRDVVESGRYPYTNYFGTLTPHDHAVVDESLLLVRALELQDRPFYAISDGQRQRIMLARALCQQPDIMVLDEPVSYLDIRYKLEFLDILREMARKKLITIVMSMHEVDLAAKVSDRVIFVKGDRIERYGAPEEIIDSGAVAELYDLETGSYNAQLGSMELAKPKGAPRVFVVSSKGSGIRVFRALQKLGIPFAAGILFDNDVDYPVAEALAGEVFVCEAFTVPGERLISRALECAETCGTLFDAVGAAGTHPANTRLLGEAGSVLRKKKIDVVTSLDDVAARRLE